MKKILVLFLMLTCAFGVFAEDTSTTVESPSVLVLPNLFGMIFGYYGADLNIGVSETVAIDTQFGYWNIRNLPFADAAIDPNYQLWYGYLQIGPTVYLDQVFHGLYVGGYVKGRYFTIGDNFTIGQAGAGVKGGWRGTWDWFSLALNVGYEYNTFFADVDFGNVKESFVSNLIGGVPVFGVEMGIAIY